MSKCQLCEGWIKNILGRDNKQVQWAWGRKGVGVLKNKECDRSIVIEGETGIRTSRAPTVMVRSHDIQMWRGDPCWGFKPRSSVIHFTFCKDLFLQNRKWVGKRQELKWGDLTGGYSSQVRNDGGLHWQRRWREVVELGYILKVKPIRHAGEGWKAGRRGKNREWLLGFVFAPLSI